MEKEPNKMDDMDKHDDDYEDLVKQEIGRSGMPRYIAEQRILAKYGSRPPAAQLLKAREAGAEFTRVVDNLRASGLSGTEAMQKARRDHPDAFEAYMES
jgi:hypothetical protein